ALPIYGLGVVDRDVAGDRHPEQAHRLLAVDQRDRPRAAPLLEPVEAARARRGEGLLLEVGRERREDEEQPEELEERVHGPPSSRPNLASRACCGTGASA